MASKTVLQEAIKKLKFNNMMLKELKIKCSTKKEADEIDKQLARNNSMILDYEFRVRKEMG